MQILIIGIDNLKTVVAVVFVIGMESHVVVLHEVEAAEEGSRELMKEPLDGVSVGRGVGRQNREDAVSGSEI